MFSGGPLGLQHTARNLLWGPPGTARLRTAVGIHVAETLDVHEWRWVRNVMQELSEMLLAKCGVLARVDDVRMPYFIRIQRRKYVQVPACADVHQVLTVLRHGCVDAVFRPIRVITLDAIDDEGKVGTHEGGGTRSRLSCYVPGRDLH